MSGFIYLLEVIHKDYITCMYKFGKTIKTVEERIKDADYKKYKNIEHINSKRVDNVSDSEKILISCAKLSFGRPIIGNECFACSKENAIKLFEDVYTFIKNLPVNVESNYIPKKIYLSPGSHFSINNHDIVKIVEYVEQKLGIGYELCLIADHDGYGIKFIRYPNMIIGSSKVLHFQFGLQKCLKCGYYPETDGTFDLNNFKNNPNEFLEFQYHDEDFYRICFKCYKFSDTETVCSLDNPLCLSLDSDLHSSLWTIKEAKIFSDAFNLIGIKTFIDRLDLYKKDAFEMSVIDTYDKYIKVSSLNEIIITDIINIDGYWQSGNWAYKSIIEEEDDDGKDALIAILENHVTYWRNNCDYGLIAADTCKTRFLPKKKCRKLKYNEIQLYQRCDILGNIVNKDLVMNCSNGDIHDINIKNMILYKYTKGKIYNTLIDIKIIDELMNAYFGNDVHLFKSTCKYIFIEKPKKTIIFNCTSIMAHIITTMLVLYTDLKHTMVHDDFNKVTKYTKIFIDYNKKHTITDIKKLTTKMRIIVLDISINKKNIDRSLLVSNVIKNHKDHFMEILKPRGGYDIENVLNSDKNISRMILDDMFTDNDSLIYDILSWVLDIKK